jgi:hypothetical protein
LPKTAEHFAFDLLKLTPSERMSAHVNEVFFRDPQIVGLEAARNLTMSLGEGEALALIGGACYTKGDGPHCLEI